MHEPVFGHGRPLASGIPPGGLGTGSVGIMETRRFRDWELFNNYQWSGDPDEAAPERTGDTMSVPADSDGRQIACSWEFRGRSLVLTPEHDLTAGAGDHLVIGARPHDEQTVTNPGAE